MVYICAHARHVRYCTAHACRPTRVALPYHCSAFVCSALLWAQKCFSAGCDKPWCSAPGVSVDLPMCAPRAGADGAWAHSVPPDAGKDVVKLYVYGAEGQEACAQRPLSGLAATQRARMPAARSAHGEGKHASAAHQRPASGAGRCGTRAGRAPPEGTCRVPSTAGCPCAATAHVRSQLGQAGPHVGGGAHLVVRQGVRNSERAFLPMIPPRMVSGIVTNALRTRPAFAGHAQPCLLART